MSKFRFELNYAGVRALMKSPEMEAITRSYAEDIKNAAGEGYEITHHIGRTRNTYDVEASTIEAKKDNYEHNTLEKAIGAAKR